MNDLNQLSKEMEEAKNQGDLAENSSYAEFRSRFNLKMLKRDLQEAEIRHKKELKVQWKPPTKLLDNKVVMGSVITTPKFGKIMIIPHWEYSDYSKLLSKSGIQAVPSNARVAIDMLGKPLSDDSVQEVYNG